MKTIRVIEDIRVADYITIQAGTELNVIDETESTYIVKFANEKINISKFQVVNRTMRNLLDSIESSRKVICITGRLAAGKSISMATIANELKEELKADLYSNNEIKNSLEMKQLSFNDQKTKIIVIDEFSHELHSVNSVFNLLAFTECENVIILFDSFNINRIPEWIRKKINLHFEVEKIDSDTIKLNGVNVCFEKTIKIEEAKHYYNAFVLPKKLNF